MRAQNDPMARKHGYRGMPCWEWTDWGQVAETFVAERPHRDPELAIDVILLGLRGVGSWGDFTAGTWLLHLGTELYLADLPGYSHRRGYQLFDRFVTWLHSRGDLSDWQWNVLLTKIDDARAAHGGPRRRQERTEEMVVSSVNRDRLVAEFLATLEDEPRRVLAESAIDCLESMLCARLGEPRNVPLGVLDVDAFIRAWLEESDEPDDLRFAADVFVLLARFYLWLGRTGRLDAARAEEIGGRLASVGLGIAAPARHAGAGTSSRPPRSGSKRG